MFARLPLAMLAAWLLATATACDKGRHVDPLQATIDFCARSVLCGGSADGGGGDARGIPGYALGECVQSHQDDDDLYADEGVVSGILATADCVAKAGTCGAYTACKAGRPQDMTFGSSKAGKVCGTEGQEYAECDGNVLLWCFGGEYDTPHYIPLGCGSIGKVCDATLKSCVDPSVSACDAGAPEVCDGDSILLCAGGKTSGSSSGKTNHGDCHRFGDNFTCIPASDERQTHCGFRDPDPACPTGESTNSGCDGTVLFSCLYGGKLTFDCADVGLACNATADGASCRAAGAH